tara:strand:+ start:11877 stop:13127 length:1251 start_codon:yes stop_codon:yes gene_type:complete
MRQLQFYIISLIGLLLYCTVAPAKSSRFRAMFRDDPSTTICIGWDQLSGENPVLHYGIRQEKDAVAQQTKPIRVVEYHKMNNHFVRLSNLKPATQYYFEVKDSEGTSKRYWFETLPNNSEVPLSIIAGGDSRRTRLGHSTWEPRVQTNKMVPKIKPHFIAFGGDFTFLDNPIQWQMWFDDWQHTIDSSGKITPLVVARGNHERENASVYNLFDSPNQRIVYALNFGGDLMRFYTLNSLDPVVESDQTLWFESDLKKHKGQEIWRFVQYHHPIVPHQSHKKIKPDEYKSWAPLFYKHKVQLAIECDAHVAKITWSIVPDANGDDGFKKVETGGTVYVGEGSWGLKRINDSDHDWTRASGSFYQFKWMVLSKGKAILRTVITESPDAVSEVDLKDRYSPPAGMELWKVNEQSEIILKP